MRLKIKTLNQKSLVIDIDDTKTVYELKLELSGYEEITVKPEFQKLIYAGKILDDYHQLSFYNIDERKHLVIMTMKEPLPELQQTSVAASRASTSRAEETGSDRESRTLMSPVSDERKEYLVKQIVGMGYPEADARRALIASFYNAERAIEYLVEGMPEDPSTPDGSDSDADLTLTAFELFRGDRVFRTLRTALQQHPQHLDSAIRRIADTNPVLLNLISDHQNEFLSLLIEGSADDEDDFDTDSDEIDANDNAG